MKAVFDNLIHLEHANIVKFHKYWADTKDGRARVCLSPTSKHYQENMIFFYIFHITFITYFIIRISRSSTDENNTNVNVPSLSGDFHY